MGTLLNLGACEEAQGHLARAWEHYRHVVEQLNPADERLAMVKQHLQALDRQVPRLTLSLSKEAPSDSMIRRDGIVLTLGSLGVPLPLDPGTHEVLVTASHHAATRLVLKVAPGDTLSLEVGPGGDVPAAHGEPTHAKDLKSSSGAHGRKPAARTWAHVALGAAAASGVASGILTWRYFVERAAIADHCPTQAGCDDMGLRAAGAAGVLQAGVAVATSVALAGLGTGIALLWIAQPNGEQARGTVPAGLAWSARF